MTPGVHHAGHRARAAQHLAARPRAYAAGGQARVVLRLGQVPPVQLGAHRRGRERRHRRGGRLLGAGLQQAHRPPGHLAQAGRDHGTGHAAAHHHEVQLLRVLQAGREPGDGRAPATRVRDRALRPDHQVDQRHEERQAAGAAARSGQERRVGPLALAAFGRHVRVLTCSGRSRNYNAVVPSRCSVLRA